jgi:nucleosome assembly protein 1-like 1
MLNNDIMVEEIKEKDEDLLKYLTRLEYETEAGTNNFTLKFHFTANEYFTNEVLTKKFYITEDDEVTKTEGTEVKWKEGKNVTVKTVKKVNNNK